MARNEHESFFLARPTTDYLVVGIDPSMSSSAVTIHRFSKDGVHAQSWYYFFPQTEAMYKMFKDDPNFTISRAVLDAPTDPELRFKRFSNIARDIHNFVFHPNIGRNLPIYISIEDYALRAMGRVYPIGEYGGILRLALLNVFNEHPVYIRETEPLTIKLYAKGGDASKTDMYEAYDRMRQSGIETATLDLSKFLEEYEKRKKSGKKVKPVTETSPFSDLVDSWWIARILEQELIARWGFVQMRDLPERVLHILNRTTKTYPVNVLNREFLRMEA